MKGFDRITMLRLRWVWIVFSNSMITNKNRAMIIVIKSIILRYGGISLISPPQPSSPPVLPPGLLHAAGMGGVSGVPPRIPAPRRSELEPMCQTRPRRLRQTGALGPGGQPKL